MQENKTKIIIFSAFYEPFMSGAEACVKVIAETAREFPQYSLTIITAYLKRGVPRIETRDGYSIVRVGFGFSYDKWLFIFLAPLYAWRLKPRVVHAVMESYAGIALIFVKIFMPRSRTILTLQSGDLDEKAGKGAIPQWLWKKIHQSPEKLTAISHFLLQRAKTLGSKDVCRISNGIDTKKLIAIRARTNEKRFDIACVARLSPEKGVEDLIESIALVKKNIPAVRVAIIGDGALREQLIQRANELFLAENITWCGALSHDEAMNTLAHARVSVVPSRAEGLGIAALEALGLGIPVVATNVGGLPDIVGDRENGLLCETRNPEDIAKKIMMLLTDTSLYAHCAGAARGSVSAFEWRTCVQAYYALYSELIKPRILIATGIYPPETGGPAGYVATIEMALRTAGFTFQTITYGNKRNVYPSHVTVINRSSFKIVHYIHYFFSVLKYARRFDIIFLQDTISAGLPTVLANFFWQRKIILKVVGDHAWEQATTGGITDDSLEDFQTRTYDCITECARFLARAVAKRTHTIITPSNYLKKMVMQWGISDTRVQVIYNAAHHVAQHEIVNWPEGDCILFVGRLVKWKCVATLIDAFEKVAQGQRTVHLVIIGEGPESTMLATQAKHSQASSRIHFLGAKTKQEVAWAMARAKIFVLPSTYEGLSHVLVEAQMAGIPTIATCIGGNPEVITHKVNGLLIAPRDAELLKNALELLLQNADIAYAISHNARRNALQFSVTKMIDATLEVLTL